MKMIRNIKYDTLSGIISYKKISNIIIKALLYAFLIEISFIFVYPLLFLATTSVKPYTDFYSIAVTWLPSRLEFSNFKYAVDFLEFDITLLNTFIVTVCATLCHVVGCSLIGYGFGRTKRKWKDMLFMIVILSIIIPVQLVYIPNFIIVAGKLNLGNSYLAVIVPALFGYGLKGGVYIYLFRQYFQAFPVEIEEAAKIDGYNSFQIFSRLAIPIAKAPILVVTILSFVWHWNDGVELPIYIWDYSKITMAQRIDLVMDVYKKRLETGQTYSYAPGPAELTEEVYNNAVFSAILLLSVIPLVVMYVILQKKFIEGVETTGVKG